MPHQADEMLESIFVAATLFISQLLGAFIKLRSHLAGLGGRATKGDKDLSQLVNFHAPILTTEAH